MVVYDDDMSSSSSDSSDDEYSGVYASSSSGPLAAEPVWMTKFARQSANATSSSSSSSSADPHSSIQSSSSVAVVVPVKGRPAAAARTIVPAAAAAAAASAPLPSSIHHGSVVVPTRGTMSPNSSFSERKTEDSPPAWMQKFSNNNNNNNNNVPPTEPLPISNASQGPEKWKPQQPSSSSSPRTFGSQNELNCDAAAAASSSSSSGDNRPEWMQKFQKIGMKGSEENVISAQGSAKAQRQHHHHQHQHHHHQQQRPIPSSAPSTPTWNKRQFTRTESSPMENAPSLHMQRQPQPSGPSFMSSSWKQSTINTAPPVGAAAAAAAAGTTPAPTTPNWMNRFENINNGSGHKPPGLPRAPVLHHDEYETDDDDEDEKSVASVRSYNGESPAWMNRFGHGHKKVTPPATRAQGAGQPEWMNRFRSNNGVSNTETTTPQQITRRPQDFSEPPQMVSTTPSSPVTSPSSQGRGGKMIMTQSNMPFPKPPMHYNRGLTSAPSSPFSNRGAIVSSFDVSGTAFGSLVGDSGKLGSAPIGTMSAPSSPTAGVVGKARPSWMLKLIQKKKGLPEEHSNKSGTPPWKIRELLKEEQARKLTEDLGLSLHNIGDENRNSADDESSEGSWDSDADSENEPESVPEWMQQFRKMHLKEARIVSAQGKAPQKVTCLRNSSAQMIKRTGDIVEDSEIVRPITVRSLSSRSLSSRSLNVSRRGKRKEKTLDKSQHLEPSCDGNVGEAYHCSGPEAIHRVDSLMRKESISTQAIMSAFSMDQEFPSSGSAGVNAFRESADDPKSLDRTFSATASTSTSENDGSVWSEPTKEMTALEKKLEGKPELNHQSDHTQDLGYQSLHTHATKDGWGAQVEIDNSVPVNAKGMWGERVNSVKPGNVTLMSFRKIRNQADRVKERIEKAKKGAVVAPQETKEEESDQKDDIPGSGSSKMTFDADESASALFFKDLAAKSPTPSDKSFSMENSAANIFGFGGGTVSSPRDETTMTVSSENTSKLSDFVESSSDAAANESRAWDTTHAVAEEPAGLGASFSQMKQIQEEGDEDDKSVDEVAGLRNKFKSFAEESVFGDIDNNNSGGLGGKAKEPTGAAPCVLKKSTWLEDSNSESGSDSADEKPKQKPNETRPNKPLSSFEGVSMVSTAPTAKQKADTESPWTQPVKKKSWLDDSDSDSDNDSSPPKAAARAATNESPASKAPVSKESWLNDSDSDSDDSSKKKAIRLSKINSVSSTPASKTTGSTSTLAADSKAKTHKDLEKKKSWLDGSDSDSGSDGNESAPKPVVAAKKATPPPLAASKPPFSKQKSWLDDSDNSDDVESAIEPLTRKKSMTPLKSDPKADTVKKTKAPSSEKKAPTETVESSKEVKLGGHFLEPTVKKYGVDKPITVDRVLKKDNSTVDKGGKTNEDDDLFSPDPMFATSLHGADQAKKEEDEWQAALQGLANEMEQEKEADAAAAAAFDPAAFGLDGNNVKSDKTKGGKDTKKGSKNTKKGNKGTKSPCSPKNKGVGSPEAKSKDTAKSSPISKKDGTKKKKVADVAEKKEKTASSKSDTKGGKKQSDVDAKPVAKLTKSKATKAESESKSKKSKKKTKVPEGSKVTKSTLTGLKQSKRNLVIKPASKKLVVAAKTTPARSGKKLVKKNAFDDEDSFMMNGNDFDDDFSVPPDFGDFAEDGSVVPLKAYRHPPSVKSKKKAATTGNTTTKKTKNKVASVADTKKNKKKEGKGAEKTSVATKKKKKK